MREGGVEELPPIFTSTYHYPCKARFALVSLGQTSDSWQWGFCKLLEEIRP